MESSFSLGVDIGGSSIKTAVVDTKRGKLASEQITIELSRFPNLALIVDSIECAAHTLDFIGGDIGIGFPGVVRETTIFSGPNMGEDVIGDHLATALFKSYRSVTMLNDADAALYHVLRNNQSLEAERLLLVTLGTSIGTALVDNGKLVQNMELGQIYNPLGEMIDVRASGFGRTEFGLGFKEWSKLVSSALTQIAHCLNPDLVILGGGVTEQHESWLHLIDSKIPVTIIPDHNSGGLIGAACWNADQRVRNKERGETIWRKPKKQIGEAIA